MHTGTKYVFEYTQIGYISQLNGFFTLFIKDDHINTSLFHILSIGSFRQSPACAGDFRVDTIANGHAIRC